MKLLAIETATEACSVAVAVDGEVVERFEIAPRRHAELVLPWADALLAETGLRRRDLDAIAVGRGPGAFTGVRLAISLAQGIALALDRPVVAVSTLATLAMRAPAPAAGPVLAAIDARMGEVYVAAFARDGEGLPQALGPERLGAPGSVPLEDLPWAAAVGSGLAAGEGALAARLRAVAFDPTAMPHAADLARLAAAAWARGEALAPERVEPAYLRDKVALTQAEQRARRG
ncbi:tRNA (adenosine(37)-N6)-threonylcarbamoyltransferase complex dimerization subunit type 1 TsaB [Coralloluteibacterium stylophorae]|uniref:tRNA threonylcarbamoyladenosine biosynthesis protein TsaB n=1 Tax=Coralloluteibacterium stylophorae TaxID=1776034 RepID=A0A8J7VUZ9_9GAMM|nr:tRNA (adenosine(37)-N6)-threonylcarbamoyltransferase complex dimerization subunit type 1 TsaB [Coralloluteibacterium stylophorae]MBS7456752.1 tRNA (adenosine(37)-N6)-threonylcarbamoyltransferase complex dimerization subunit type 1 TsaB [Coralloluteibacterium stylophorae]